MMSRISPFFAGIGRVGRVGRVGVAALGLAALPGAVPPQASVVQSDTTRLNEFQPGLNPALALTADGSALAYVLSPTGAEYSTIWVKDLSTGRTVQLPGRVSQRLEEGTRRQRVRPRWSPDGSRLGYLAERERDSSLAVYVWRRDNGSHRLMTERKPCSSTCPEYEFQWSPDGRLIYYFVENEAVRALDPEVYASVAGANGNARLAERRRLLFQDPENGGVTVRVSSPEARAGSSAKTDGVKPISDVVVTDVETGKTTTVLTGANLNRLLLSPDGTKLLAIALDKTSTEVRQAYQSFYVLSLPAAWPWPNAKADFVSDAVTVRDWRGVEVAPVLPDVKQFYVGRASWAPSSRSIAFAEQGAIADGNVFVVDADGGKARNLTSALELPAQPEDLPVVDPSKVTGRTFAYAGKFGQVYVPPIWSRDGATLFALRDDDERTGVWAISVSDGSARRLTKGADFDVLHIFSDQNVATPGPRGADLLVVVRFPDTQLGFISIDPKTMATRVLSRFPGYGMYPFPRVMTTTALRVPRVAFVNETPTAPPEVWSFDARSAKVEQLTAVNRSFAVRDPGERRQISWKRPDGQTRHALLHLPPAGSRAPNAGPPPVIMEIYPRDAAGEVESGQFPHRPSLYLKPLYELLHAGYAILKPSIAIKAGGGACVDVGEEVVRALDAAGATGLVDASRAAVMGHSFGGWTVNCVVTQTDRFRAAVGVAGLADMISNAFSPDQSTWALGGGQTNIDRSLWEAPELFLAESPALGAPKVKTPLLLIHGKGDATVPVDQSLEMYVALSRLGKTVTYVAYDNRGHSDVADHPDYAKRVIAWLGRYLTPAAP